MEKVVLATLHYAAATKIPLTAVQVWRRLIHYERMNSERAPTLAEILQILNDLVIQKRVREKYGWYVPYNIDEQLFNNRLEQLNISTDKWKRMLNYAWWFQAIPFIRTLAASGSLASETTDSESDWDMFVIARNGRLYTARICLLFVAQFMGRLRVKEHRVANDLFCFNHYVVDSGLLMRHRSLYVAYEMAGLVPIYDPDGCIPRLWASNKWLGEYFSYIPKKSINIRRTVVRSRMLSIIRKTLEIIIDATIGWLLELVLMWWQRRRISLVPATYETGGRVVADKKEIEFHPRSSERTVLSRYNASLSIIGITTHEHDSGLTQ